MSDEQVGGAGLPLVPKKMTRDEVIPPSPTPPGPGEDVHVPITSLGCLGLLGTIFGHRYEGRYDESLPSGNIEGGVAVIKAIKNRVYRGDVCRRCGNVVNEPTKENQHGQ